MARVKAALMNWQELPGRRATFCGRLRGCGKLRGMNLPGPLRGMNWWWGGAAARGLNYCPKPAIQAISLLKGTRLRRLTQKSR